MSLRRYLYLSSSDDSDDLDLSLDLLLATSTSRPSRFSSSRRSILSSSDDDDDGYGGHDPFLDSLLLTTPLEDDDEDGFPRIELSRSKIKFRPDLGIDDLGIDDRGVAGDDDEDEDDDLSPFSPFGLLLTPTASDDEEDSDADVEEIDPVVPTRNKTEQDDDDDSIPLPPLPPPPPPFPYSLTTFVFTTCLSSSTSSSFSLPLPHLVRTSFENLHLLKKAEIALLANDTETSSQFYRELAQKLSLLLFDSMEETENNENSRIRDLFVGYCRTMGLFNLVHGLERKRRFSAIDNDDDDENGQDDRLWKTVLSRLDSLPRLPTTRRIMMDSNSTLIAIITSTLRTFLKSYLYHTYLHQPTTAKIALQTHLIDSKIQLELPAEVEVGLRRNIEVASMAAEQRKESLVATNVTASASIAREDDQELLFRSPVIRHFFVWAKSALMVECDDEGEFGGELILETKDLLSRLDREVNHKKKNRRRNEKEEEEEEGESREQFDNQEQQQQQQQLLLFDEYCPEEGDFDDSFLPDNVPHPAKDPFVSPEKVQRAKEAWSMVAINKKKNTSLQPVIRQDGLIDEFDIIENEEEEFDESFLPIIMKSDNQKKKKKKKSALVNHEEIIRSGLLSEYSQQQQQDDDFDESFLPDDVPHPAADPFVSPEKVRQSKKSWRVIQDQTTKNKTLPVIRQDGLLDEFDDDDNDEFDASFLSNVLKKKRAVSSLVEKKKKISLMDRDELMNSGLLTEFSAHSPDDDDEEEGREEGGESLATSLSGLVRESELLRGGFMDELDNDEEDGFAGGDVDLEGGGDLFGFDNEIMMLGDIGGDDGDIEEEESWRTRW